MGVNFLISCSFSSLFSILLFVSLFNSFILLFLGPLLGARTPDPLRRPEGLKQPPLPLPLFVGPIENLLLGTLFKLLPLRNLLPGASLDDELRLEELLVVLLMGVVLKEVLGGEDLLVTGFSPVIVEARAAASFLSNLESVEEILFEGGAEEVVSVAAVAEEEKSAGDVLRGLPLGRLDDVFDKAEVRPLEEKRVREDRGSVGLSVMELRGEELALLVLLSEEDLSAKGPDVGRRRWLPLSILRPCVREQTRRDGVPYSGPRTALQQL